MYSRNDLILYFVAYPGTHYIGFNGAWAAFAGMGITKAKVADFLRGNFEIEYLGQIAEMPAWRIR